MIVPLYGNQDASYIRGSAIVWMTDDGSDARFAINGFWFNGSILPADADAIKAHFAHVQLGGGRLFVDHVDSIRTWSESDGSTTALVYPRDARETPICATMVRFVQPAQLTAFGSPWDALPPEVASAAVDFEALFRKAQLEIDIVCDLDGLEVFRRAWLSMKGQLPKLYAMLSRVPPEQADAMRAKIHDFRQGIYDLFDSKRALLPG